MGYKNDLLLEFLPWARSYARACAVKFSRHPNRDDLQSAGMLGYIRAVDRYDASKGASFCGFCAIRIRGAMMDELRRWDWVPRSIYKRRQRITSVTSRLIAQLDREPTHTELAAALGIDPAEFAAFQTRIQTRTLVSFDEISETLNAGERFPLSEHLPDPRDKRPDQAVIRAEDRRTLLECIGQLSESEAKVIILHYLKNVPLRHIAGILAVTPTRVSQLHGRALNHIRQNWR